jgi:HSP20 family protein
MRRMSDDLNQLLDAVGFFGNRPRGMAGAGLWAPSLEIQQKKDALVVRADLPGVKPEEVDVTVEDGALVISGERRQERREEQEGVVRTELSYGSFYRAIPLPDGADEDRVSASLKNGTLEITVPLDESGRQRGRRVKVQS